MNETTLSRRNVPRTTTVTALGVGLMAAAGTRPAPVATNTADPARDLISALCAESDPGGDDFAAQLDERQAVRDRVGAERRSLREALEAYVPAERHDELLGPCNDVTYESAALDQALHRELLFRHLPGFAPALRLLWEHVADTRLDELEA